MIAFAITVVIVCITFLLAQESRQTFLLNQAELHKEVSESLTAELHKDLTRLETEFAEYKKRTDSLSLKIGFKI